MVPNCPISRDVKFKKYKWPFMRTLAVDLSPTRPRKGLKFLLLYVLSLRNGDRSMNALEKRKNVIVKFLQKKRKKTDLVLLQFLLQYLPYKSKILYNRRDKTEDGTSKR